MKKFGFATIIASGLAAAMLGFAAPGQATVSGERCGRRRSRAPQGIDHLDWLNDIQQKPNVARPDTTRAEQSR